MDAVIVGRAFIAGPRAPSILPPATAFRYPVLLTHHSNNINPQVIALIDLRTDLAS